MLLHHFTKDQELLYFPTNVTSVNIVDHFNKNVCRARDSVFKVTKGKSKGFSKNKTGPRVKKIKIQCERSQLYQDQLGKRGVKRKSTGTLKSAKPTQPEHRCPLYFNVYEQEDGRLFVRKNGGCNWEHKNHTKIPKKLMRDGISMLSLKIRWKRPGNYFLKTWT